MEGLITAGLATYVTIQASAFGSGLIASMVGGAIAGAIRLMKSVEKMSSTLNIFSTISTLVLGLFY